SGLCLLTPAPAAGMTSVANLPSRRAARRLRADVRMTVRFRSSKPTGQAPQDHETARVPETPCWNDLSRDTSRCLTPSPIPDVPLIYFPAVDRSAEFSEAARRMGTGDVPQGRQQTEPAARMRAPW